MEEDTSPFFMDCSPDTYCRDWPFNILLVRPTVCTSRPLHARMVVVDACPSTVLIEDNHCFIKRQFLAEKFFGFSLEWNGMEKFLLAKKGLDSPLQLVVAVKFSGVYELETWIFQVHSMFLPDPNIHFLDPTVQAKIVMVETFRMFFQSAPPSAFADFSKCSVSLWWTPALTLLASRLPPSLCHLVPLCMHLCHTLSVCLCHITT